MLNFLSCCGLTFLASLLSSEIEYLFGDLTKLTKDEIGGTVVLLQRAELSQCRSFFIAWPLHEFTS